MTITAILIAAGLSTRMQGPNKLLQSIGGKSLIQHSYSHLINAPVDEVIVVTGRDSARIESALVNSQWPKAKFVHNTNFEEGMTTSIQAGLKEATKADAVMICLSDMPEIRSDDYNVLLDEFRNKGGSDKILAPFKNGRKGNPVIFGSAYFTPMAEHKEPNGCSSIVKAHKEQLIKYATDSEAYFFDIDTPETLKAYISSAK